ncbi:hypothetical protein DENSPDRAFT_874792 [Dentipellis sp. KUC8613]|nr:hypothetical protein DENSPDRAFT_874792 [Dentipellis sp. KUC8613]
MTLFPISTGVFCTNRHQPYPWAGAPDQVSGSSAHTAAPPATVYSQNGATHGGYPPDQSFSSAHGASFQNSGNPTLHPYYDPHPDQFNATLESAFPHLHTPQIGSTASATGGSTYQGYAPGSLGTNFPYSSYSELANYAGDYRQAGKASGAAHAAVLSEGMALASNLHNNSMSGRRASVTEPSATKGEKRKSRKSTTDALAVQQGESRGEEPDEERARKKKKAMQQRFYRESYSNVVKRLDAVLPDDYKVNEARLTRKTVARGVDYIEDLAREKEKLKNELTARNALLQNAHKEYRSLHDKHMLTSQENERLRMEQDRLRNTIENLQTRVRYLETMGR